MYSPHPKSHYFGQRLLYNDCVYRHRHVYEFIFLWDADEFIYFPKNAPSSILDWLANTIPLNSSGASFRCAYYPVVCEVKLKRPVNTATNYTARSQTYTGYYVFQEGFSPPPLVKCHKDGMCLQKSVVRPLAIMAVIVHRPQSLNPGWMAWVHVEPAIAYYKHLRCHWKEET